MARSDGPREWHSWPRSADQISRNGFDRLVSIRSLCSSLRTTSGVSAVTRSQPGDYLLIMICHLNFKVYIGACFVLLVLLFSRHSEA